MLDPSSVFAVVVIAGGLGALTVVGLVGTWRPAWGKPVQWAFPIRGRWLSMLFSGLLLPAWLLVGWWICSEVGPGARGVSQGPLTEQWRDAGPLFLAVLGGATLLGLHGPLERLAWRRKGCGMNTFEWLRSRLGAMFRVREAEITLDTPLASLVRRTEGAEDSRHVVKLVMSVEEEVEGVIPGGEVSDKEAGAIAALFRTGTVGDLVEWIDRRR